MSAQSTATYRGGCDDAKFCRHPLQGIRSPTSLVETRLNEIRSSQMTQLDDSIMYHSQSFTKEPETIAFNFSNADKEGLYHAQCQEQPRPAPPHSQSSCSVPTSQRPTPHLQTRPAPPTPPPPPRAHVGMRNVKMATNLRPNTQRSSP